MVTNTNLNIEDARIASIVIRPQADLAIISLTTEAVKLRSYAQGRVIQIDEDISPATNDLALIANLKKALKEKQDAYVKPIKGHLADVQVVFNELLAILEDANQLNRSKIEAYRNAQKRRQAEADELNRQALELARKQAEFSGTGEHTVDLTPVEAAPVVNKVSTDMGTTSFVKHWKWEIEDRSKIPSDYMIVDGARITKEVGKGVRSIPGLRIYCEEEVRVNTR